MSWTRPFGPNAPWNRPVAGLPVHPQSSTYVDRLMSTTNGQWQLTLSEWTYPVYRVTPGLSEHLVRLAYTDWGPESNLHNKTMPWNPAWIAASGTDSQVIVLDPATGREWNLWQVDYNEETGVIEASAGSIISGNYWTKEVSDFGGRGCGIQTYAMLTEAEEVEAGPILHALPLVVPNTDGDSYVAPATKLEHPNNPFGVPEGMRFALNVTDAQITTHINSFPSGVTTATRETVRKIAVCLRDYGVIVVGTGGTTHIQLEDYLTGEPLWTTLGMNVYASSGRWFPSSALSGLITQSRVYSLVPSDQYPSVQMMRRRCFATRLTCASA